LIIDFIGRCGLHQAGSLSRVAVIHVYQRRPGPGQASCATPVSYALMIVM
jgi:hypothetical protein